MGNEGLGDDERDALERLAAAATPGPWSVEHEEGSVFSVYSQHADADKIGHHSRTVLGGDHDGLIVGRDDAFFIAAAREAVPALIRDFRRCAVMHLQRAHEVFQARDERDAWKARAEGAEERGKSVLAAKNEWADRARAAESELAKLLEERERCRTLLVRSHLVADFVGCVPSSEMLAKAQSYVKDVVAYLHEVANA
jgi:hypothetical protein